MVAQHYMHLNLHGCVFSLPSKVNIDILTSTVIFHHCYYFQHPSTCSWPVW